MPSMSMREMVETQSVALGLPSDALTPLALAILADVMQVCGEWDSTDDIISIYQREIKELRHEETQG